jgi:ubiquinone/menaquinone biosynthesis C-methylase UbiE
MSEATSETFNAAMAAWRQWQDTPWGRLRYSLAEANLSRHLDGRPLRVLDVAGGNGVDAVRLALHGHRVTIVDYSAQMLASAREVAGAAGVAGRVSCVESDVAKLADVVEPGDYDLVLCHNLLPYVPDPVATLHTVLRPLRPGGLLSLICVNGHSEVLRVAIRDMDPVAAREALDSDEAWTQTFGTAVRRYTAEQVRPMLARAGAPVIGHYGIRAVCDYLPDDERKYDVSFFAALEQLERRLADRTPYLHTARFFHLVALKAER